MSCHNGHGAKKVLGALRNVDTSIKEADSSFWHRTLGTHKGSLAKSDPATAINAVDAAWLAATKNNGDWANMTPQERLDVQQQFRELRSEIESGELSLTENQVSKLSTYVTKKKSTPTITRVGALAAGVLISLCVAGSMAPHADAATVQKPIAANSQNADLLHMPVGKNGLCVADFAVAKAGKTHKVTWRKPNGKIVTKKMNKGTKACIYTGSNGVAETAPTTPDGTLTALPSNFPKNPTAADISSLGLTPDSKVSPDIRMPMPTGTPLAPAELADRIMPVGITKTTTETIPSGTGTIEKQIMWVEWEIQGGEGILSTSGKDPATGELNTRYVKLDPNGTTRVTIPQAVKTDFGKDNIARYTFAGFVIPDYGQANLPMSMYKNWNLDSQRAMDSTGRGYTAGKYSNTANPSWLVGNGHPNDGWFTMNPEGAIVSVPD